MDATADVDAATSLDLQLRSLRDAFELGALTRTQFEAAEAKIKPACQRSGTVAASGSGGAVAASASGTSCSGGGAHGSGLGASHSSIEQAPVDITVSASDASTATIPTPLALAGSSSLSMPGSPDSWSRSPPPCRTRRRHQRTAPRRRLWRTRRPVRSSSPRRPAPAPALVLE